jgi:hypothetical protein
MVIGVIVLAGLIYLMGFALAGSTQARELSANEQKWQAQNITHYRMKVHIGCFCPFFDRMPVTVEVQDGKVLSVTDSQGQPVAEDDPIRSFGNESLMTIPGIFAYAREALQTADETTLSYDPALGYPVSLSIDRIKLAMDDEMSVLISELEVLP